MDESLLSDIINKFIYRNGDNMYNTVFLFDTSIATENLGDYIIMNAVKKQLQEMLPHSFFVSSATHDTLGKEAKKWNKKAKYSFIGGTNLLTNRFIGRNHSQWKYGFRDLQVKNSIGVGLGWQSYHEYNNILNLPFKLAQQELYKYSLSHEYAHSVRDSYTQKRLAEFGIESINTSCVTMWDLTEEHLAQIPAGKADTVITTITNYCKTPEYIQMYEKLLDTLLNSYQHVKLWIQAKEDFDIFNQLNVKNLKKIEFISPNLNAFDNELTQRVDYIGTRLHAGIRALQYKNRSLIIELDNRAHEIAKDTNLPTLDYRKINKLEEFIDCPQDMDIHVPFDNIKRWKEQFHV